MVMKITLIIEVLYTISVGLIKISVLLFYWRLTSGILPRVFAHILWLCIGLVVAFIIVFTIFPFVQCRPFIAFCKSQACTIQPPRCNIWSIYNAYLYPELIQVITKSLPSGPHVVSSSSLPLHKRPLQHLYRFNHQHAPRLPRRPPPHSLLLPPQNPLAPKDRTRLRVRGWFLPVRRGHRPHDLRLEDLQRYV